MLKCNYLKIKYLSHILTSVKKPLFKCKDIEKSVKNLLKRKTLKTNNV